MKLILKLLNVQKLKLMLKVLLISRKAIFDKIKQFIIKIKTINKLDNLLTT